MMLYNWNCPNCVRRRPKCETNFDKITYMPVTKSCCDADFAVSFPRRSRNVLITISYSGLLLGVITTIQLATGQLPSSNRNTQPSQFFSNSNQGFSYQNQLYNTNGFNNDQTSFGQQAGNTAKQPSAPQNLRATDITDTSVRLAWNNDINTNQPPPEHYVIHYREKNTLAAEREVVGVDSNAYVLDNLQPSTLYQANVRAVRGGVQSAESDIIDFETKDGNSPIDVEAAAISQDTIRVAWRPPVRPSTNSQLQGYTVYYTRDPSQPLSSWQSREVRASSLPSSSSSNQQQAASSSNIPTNLFISDLIARTFYTIVVQSIYYPSERHGTVSRAIVVKTQTGIPPQPRDVVVEQQPATSNNNQQQSTNAVRVRWRMPTQALLNAADRGALSTSMPAILRYDVYYNASINQQQPQQQRKQSVSMYETMADLRDLLPGTDYHVWVEAVSPQGAGPPSEVQVVRTRQAPPSGAPQAVTVEALDAQTLRIRWQPPADDKQHGTLRVYKIFVKPTGDADAAAVQVKTVPFSAHSLDVDGLQIWTEYTVWMTASNDAGESPESEMVNVRTLESVPAAPEELIFYLINATTVQITWEEPQARHAEIRYYMVYWSEKGTNTEQEIGPVWVPGERRVTIGELRPGREYRVQVVAFGTRGDGERSKVLRIQLPTVAPPAPLLRVDFDENQLKAIVKWSGPDGYEQDIVGYSVAYGDVSPAAAAEGGNDANALKPPFPPSKLSGLGAEENFVRREMAKNEYELVVTGLDRGKRYEFRVAAKFVTSNHNNNAAESGSSTVERLGSVALQHLVVPEGIPEAAPTNIRYQFDQQKQLTFLWDPPAYAKRNGQISQYQVELYELDPSIPTASGVGRETLIYNLTVQLARFTVQRLRAHDRYLFRVAASTSRGQGPFSGGVYVEMPLEVPRPPAGINATAVNRTAAEVWWTPVKMPFRASNLPNSQQQADSVGAELLANSVQHHQQHHADAAEPTASRLEIRGYKIYYSKTLDLSNMDAWRSIQVRGADSWRVRVGDLEENATYAVIVAAETATVTGYLSEHITFRVFPELVPRDLHAIALTKDSVTLAWRAPLKGAVGYYKVTCEGKRDFLDQHGVLQAPKVPPCQAVNVTNNSSQVRLEHLVPYTNYIFSVMMIPVAQPSYVPPVMLYNQTSADVPNHLLAPKVVAAANKIMQINNLTAEPFVDLHLERASEKRGPIDKYWIVVVPMSNVGGGEMRRPEDYTTQELVDGSDIMADYQRRAAAPEGGSSSAETTLAKQTKLVPYVAASFSGEALPNTFTLGNNERYGSFQNHRLVLYVPASTAVEGGGAEQQKYRVFLRAFIRKQQNDHTLSGRSDLIFKSSEYSDIFSPSIVAGSSDANGGASPPLTSRNNNHHSASNALSISAADAEKVASWIWVSIALAAIVAVVLCGFLVIVYVSKHRQSARKQQQQQQNGATKSIGYHNNNNNGTIGRNGTATRAPPSGSQTAHVHYQAVPAINGMNDSLHDNNNSFGFNNINNTNSITLTMSGTPTPQNQLAETQPFLSLHTQPYHGNGNMLNNTGGMDLYDGGGDGVGVGGDFSLTNTTNIIQLASGGTAMSDEFNAEFDDSEDDNATTHSSHRSSSILLQQQLQLQQQQRDPVEDKRTLQPTMQLEKHPPIPIGDVGSSSSGQQLVMHINDLKASDNFLFSAEFESIETSKEFTWHNSLLELNKSKNRYANVVAYDHSRVILKTLDGIPCSDYINANYCDGYRRYNAYIATQGPLPETFGDFWRMVWEQDSHIIVMLTRLEERGRIKCDQYWPPRGTETYGLMHVTLLEQQELAFYTLRSFAIQPVGHPGDPRHVRQVQFTAWPDHGVPDCATPFLAFVQRVRTLQAAADVAASAAAVNSANLTGPMVIHCSAGVGRTGAYIVIDAMLQRLRVPTTTTQSAISTAAKSMDIYGHVTCLREQRNFMVQTEDQYVFIYDAVLEAVLSGLQQSTDSPVSKFYKRVQRLLRTTPSGYSQADVQFEKLNQFCGRGGSDAGAKFTNAMLPCNKYKNRLVNILPQDATRACLQPLPGLEGSDYVNASYIDGYRLRNAYIATQAPLKTTVDDFWRLIWEHNSTIIVMLTKCREMGVEKSEQYWPVEHVARYLNFVVHPVAEYSMLQYVLREFRITDSRDGQSRTVRQFQYMEWPEQGVPSLADPFIDFIGQVHKTKEQFGQDGPITVHCSTGVGRTGVFIGLSIILERLQYENAVDVYTTVKLMRAQRMQMVQTEEQYKFLYSAVLNYLSSFEGQVT